MATSISVMAADEVLTIRWSPDDSEWGPVTREKQAAAVTCTICPPLLRGDGHQVGEANRNPKPDAFPLYLPPFLQPHQCANSILLHETGHAQLLGRPGPASFGSFSHLQRMLQALCEFRRIRWQLLCVDIDAVVHIAS